MLGFRSKGRFRISKAFDSERIATNIVNFLAVSNKYGLIFLVNDECLNILDTSVIRNHIVTKENFKQEQTSFAIKSFDPGCAVERVDCNFDGSLVSIVLKSANAGFALIYDVRCFLSGFNGNALPLCKIHLYINQTASIQTSCLSCFQWNPGVANVFAVCACDGTISTYQIEDVDKVTVEGVLETSNPKAVCLSWSPKGKQLVVGYDDCSLSQFKPNLHLAKKIDPINAEIAGFQCTIVDICWLSTTHFIVLLSDKKDQYRVSLLHLTLNKEGPPTFKNFEDVCFGISTKFKPHYYISHVLEWKLIICSSTNSMESAVVGYNSDKKDWEIWTMDDEERAELPLNSLENETFPVGVALDLVDSEKDQSPLLLVLSNDGVLCPFQINYKGPHSKDPICKARERNISFSDVKTSKMFAARSSDFFAAIKSSQNSGRPITTSSALAPPVVPIAQQQPLAAVKDAALSRPITAVAEIVDASPKKTVAFAERSPDILHYDTTAEPQKVAGAKEEKLNVLRGEIAKIMSQFESGTQQLRAVFSQPLENKANMEADLQKISQSIQKSDVIVKKDKEITEHLDIASAELHRRMINEKSSLDSCQCAFQKRSSVQEQILLKERPLTSQQEKFLNETNNRIENIDQTLNDLSERFSAVLSSVLEKKFERPKSNSKDLVYRTLTNMQSIIVLQKEKINELKNSSKFLKKTNIDPQKFKNLTSGRISTDQSAKSLYRESKPVIVARDTPLKRFLMTRNRVPVRITAPAPETLNASKSLEILAALKKMDEEQTKMALPIEINKISVAEKTSKPAIEKPEAVPLPSKPQKTETIRKSEQVKSPTAQPATTPAVFIPKTQPALPKVSEVIKVSTPVSNFALPPVQQQKPAMPQIWSSATPILAPTSTIPNVKPTSMAPTIFSMASNQSVFKPSATTAFTAKSSTIANTTANIASSIFSQKVLTDAVEKSEPKKEVKEQLIAAVKENDQPNIIATATSGGKSPAEAPKIAQSSERSTPVETKTVPEVKDTPVKDDSCQKIDITNQQTSDSSIEVNSLRTLSSLIDSLNKEDEKPEVVTTNDGEKAKVPEVSTPVVQPAKQTENPPIEASNLSNRIVATSSESKSIPTTVSVTSTTAPNGTSTVSAGPATSTVSSAPQQPSIPKVESSSKMEEGDMEAENGKQDTASNAVDFSFSICKPSGEGIFGGLGGAPKPESANKNVFGTVTFGQLGTSTPSTTSSIFGSPFSQSKSSPFGAATATTPATGSAFGSLSPFGKPAAGSPFSSTTGGTIAQQGFSTAGSPLPAATAAGGSSGFGSPATFGGSPIFGSKSIFGSGGGAAASTPPTAGSIFGGGAKFGSGAVFGGSSPAAAAQPAAGSIFGGGGGGSSGFAAFAATNAPTFGSLAGSPGAAPASVFGGGSIFGGAAANTSQQQSQRPTAPSFSQWRG